MSLIKLPQIQGGARLAHANLKHYGIEESPILPDQEERDFFILNKPYNASYTTFYDTSNASLMETVQLEINQYRYRQGTDFVFDRSNGHIIWTNTSENNGFDITYDICDSVNMIYAYTYANEKPQTFTFNKNKSISIDFVVDNKTYKFNNVSLNTEYGDFHICINYDSNVIPHITKELFDNDSNGVFSGIIEYYCQTHQAKLIRKNDGAGILFRSTLTSGGENYGKIHLDYSSADMAVSDGNWDNASTESTNFETIKKLAKSLEASYNNGEDISIEFM